MADIVKVGSFCPNPDCPKHGQTEGNEIIRHGWTGPRSVGQGKQRFRCKCRGQSFNENRGTLFYRKRTPEKDVTEALAMLADGSGVNSVARVKGVTADTVVAWQREAGAHAEAVSDVLLDDHEAGPSQIDGLWSFVVHKGSKKTCRRRRLRAPSGGRRCWRWRRGCGWPRGWASRRPKPASRRSGS